MKIRWLPVVLAVLFGLPSFDVAARGKSSGKTSASAKGKLTAKAKGARSGRGKHSRARRAPPPPMVQGEGAATPAKADPVISRNIPARTYAADGQSFYLNGERIRVRGVPFVGPDGSELAKQRLQKVLDSGDVTLAETGVDTDGNTIAIVHVNGRDVADLLLLDEIRSGNLP